MKFGKIPGAIFCFLSTWIFLSSSFAQTTFISFGSTWKYLDNNTRPAGWESGGYNDNSWSAGSAVLGYGDGQTTIVSFGPDANNKYITTYFRKTVTIADPSLFSNFAINIVRDDGAVVYINGTEVLRSNMPASPTVINHVTTASTAISGTGETQVYSFPVAAGYFTSGINTISVEIHQSDITSSDISFDLSLTGNLAGSVSLTRGPYLQMGSQTGITLRWRTNDVSGSRVELGTSLGNYPIVVDDPSLVTEHVLPVTGLNLDTRYYYRIGSVTQLLQGDAANFFVTLPLSGFRKTRIAAFGDCGRNDNNFQSQTLASYQNFLSANGIDAPDAWLLLGDNAYNSGTDTEFGTNFFSAYGSSILKNHKLYPSPGNHEYANNASRQADHVIPYYDIFSVPQNAECGGLASGTERYYSFDVGDIHFLSLDSYGFDMPGNLRLYDTSGAQVTWIKNDLVANTKKWVVAYWHHPPYSKGNNNSDTENELINIRENFIRILERYGVDMILCGHSHDYERSYLLRGYYKVNPGDLPLSETDFSAVIHTASNSSAKYDGSDNSCPYIYKQGKYNHGSVYVVSGNSGADGGVQSGYPHNALPFSDQLLGGMFYFEADSNRLDAKYIRSNGTIGDSFTIMHDVNVADTFFITSGTQVTLNASWGGNYNWSTTATTRAITVTPSEGLSKYIVVDNQGCLKDSFTVYANVCMDNINTWVGNVSTAWENPANWSCGAVPNINSEVMINPGTPFAAIVNSDVVIKNITIKTGASVTVLSGFKLDIKEPL